MSSNSFEDSIVARPKYKLVNIMSLFINNVRFVIKDSGIIFYKFMSNFVRSLFLLFQMENFHFEDGCDEMKHNPWSVQSVEDFRFYNCPECDHKESIKSEFLKHAMNNHPRSGGFINSLEVLDQKEPKIEELTIKEEQPADEVMSSPSESKATRARNHQESHSSESKEVSQSLSKRPTLTQAEEVADKPVDQFIAMVAKTKKSPFVRAFETMAKKKQKPSGANQPQNSKTGSDKDDPMQLSDSRRIVNSSPKKHANWQKMVAAKVALANDKQQLPEESQPTIQTRSAKRAKIDNDQSERKSDDAVEDYSIDDDHTGDYNF